MVKYLGSKRLLLPTILGAVRALPGVTTVADLFSGTSRVGHALKAAGYRVLASDHNAYAEVLARCYVQADRSDHLGDAQALLRELNALPGAPGYFTATFCEQARYIQPRNGERIDAIRDRIAASAHPPELEAILLVSLMEAADRVDSTTGVQMAYLKRWSTRSHNDLDLRMPALLDCPVHGRCRAYRLDAAEAAARLDADAVYLDPPYNQHSYLGNYHVWESLVLWDKPEVYGVARKRIDCRDRRSDFNSRARFAPAMARLLGAIRARYLIVSFSNEGFCTRAEMEAILRGWAGAAGGVAIIERDNRRYVGAQIGIYNPRGEKVGKVGHLRNTEYLYVASREGVPELQGSPAVPGCPSSVGSVASTP